MLPNYYFILHNIYQLLDLQNFYLVLDLLLMLISVCITGLKNAI